MSNQVQTVVCFALSHEAEAIEWKVFRSRSKILITGIGKQNAETSFRDLLARLAPQRVFTCGFAGGLNPEFKLGDVILETSDAVLRDRLIAAGAKPAKFVCATQIASTAAEKQELRRTTGADAVEMESEVIQAICREHGIPCATVRVISDTASEDLPLDFNALSNADHSVNYLKLALTVAKSPGKIPALLRLQRNCSLAAKRLADVLGRIIPSP